MTLLLRVVLAVLPVIAGCSATSSPGVTGQGTRDAAAASAPASFVNRVWVVAESKEVAQGDLRVFLSEGTLVMASQHATPALGTWRYHDGQLTITEEGIDYPVDIIGIDKTTFSIRIRGPGEPVNIRFLPAEQPPLSGSSAKPPEGR